MKRTIYLLLTAALCVCGALKIQAATLAIDSLTGPVTQNEIDSFKAYMATQMPPPNGWTVYPNTISHNTWADGYGGNDLEAMGMMYEISGDITILTNMIAWTDYCVSQRNDLMSAANGGQRVMWTNGIAPVWCPEPPTNDYAGGENGDTKAHILYTALLILQNPSLWNQTVPDGNPYGYGATYLDRAKNYVQKCDEANDGYDYIFVQPDDTTGNPVGWPSGFHTMDANNIRAMMDGDFERDAQCHEILGDDPSRVASYDAVVEADYGACISGMAGYHPTTVNGDPCFDWGYYPTDVYPSHTESVGHGAYDAIGIWRSYTRSVYGYSLSTVKPFANALVDVMKIATNSFSGNVDGTGTTQNYMQQQWLLLSDMRSSVYDVVATADLASGRYRSNPYLDATILWVKNRRYQEFAVAATPASQTVTAGSGTSYTVAMTPLAGFTGTVNLSVSGLPSGASGSFNHSSINPANINAYSTNVTLNVSTSSSTPVGNYTLTITGTSGSVQHSATVTLAVTSSALPSGWTDADIGSVGSAGSASYSSGTFTLNGSGSDIWGTADSFNYAYESVSGDQTIVARVATEENTSSWAKNGVMFRESTANNASYVGLYVTPGNGVSMQYRNGTGTSAVDLGRQAGLTAPCWVKLVRLGDTFTGYSSADGSTWTQVGSLSVTMASGVKAGLADCAHNNTTLNTSTFDNVSVSVAIDTTATYQIQNEASGLVLNNQGSLTNGSAITQWSSVSSDNLCWTFIPTSNGYYQINSVKSGKDAVVQGASTSQGAGIIQWSFGSSGDDQWLPVPNSDGSYTFYNLHSGLALDDPGGSTDTHTQMDQWGANGGSNQKWNLLKQ